MRLSACRGMVIGALALAGCAEPEVVRVVDGRPQVGRYISSFSYAMYGRGADAEAHGDLAGAARLYQLAAMEDPRSPEIWTRLGAMRCRGLRPGEGPPAEALGDFDRAEAAEASFAPLHRERARCLLAGGRAPEALAEAERAGALDPSDLATFVVRAQAQERAGDAASARRTLRALTVSHPGALEPWLALLDLGTRAGDVPLVHEAARRAGELGAPGALAAAEPVLVLLDAALRADDLAGARHLAKRARLGQAELAVRAAALGRAALAREQAELVLEADPADASARLALASAADLTGDAAALERALRAVPRRHTAPSPLARLLFAEVLARRAGADAARAWLDAAGPGEPGPPDDTLLAATAERLRLRLARR